MDKIYLKDTIMKFNYNVQKVRFLAAILVIVSHAYLISGLEKDPLFILTKGVLTCGGLSVYIFLFLSGIYTARSYESEGSGKNKIFFISKVKRLWPGLFVTVITTTFIVGPIFTNLAIKGYLLDENTWKYLLNCIFIIQHKLPGVFENNTYTLSVNGSLWSLPLEVLCYIATVILFKTRILSKKISVRIAFFEILSGQVLICYLINKIDFLRGYQYHLHLCLVFILGVMCYLYKEKIYLSRYMQIIMIILVLLSIYLNISPRIWIFLFLYIMLVFCFSNNGTSNILSLLGKYSYEIYLVGFLVQQCVCYLFGGVMNPYINMVISIPVSIVMAILINRITLCLLLKRKQNREGL